MTCLWIFYVLTPFFTPLAHVVTYIGVYNIYFHSKCFLSALFASCHHSQRKSFCLVTQVHTRMPLLEAAHYAQTNITLPTETKVLLVCFCCEHMRHCRCFPLEGQCCECFTSSRLSWDAAGLGLPCEVPLAVTFPSCERIINSQTRISRKTLCVILPPHDLCIRNAFKMVMSVRWKNSFSVHFHVLQAIP